MLFKLNSRTYIYKNKRKTSSANLTKIAAKVLLLFINKASAKVPVNGMIKMPSLPNHMETGSKIYTASSDGLKGNINE